MQTLRLELLLEIEKLKSTVTGAPKPVGFWGSFQNWVPAISVHNLLIGGGVCLGVFLSYKYVLPYVVTFYDAVLRSLKSQNEATSAFVESNEAAISGLEKTKAVADCGSERMRALEVSVGELNESIKSISVQNNLEFSTFKDIFQRHSVCIGLHEDKLEALLHQISENSTTFAGLAISVKFVEDLILMHSENLVELEKQCNASSINIDELETKLEQNNENIQATSETLNFILEKIRVINSELVKK